ncbi:hypothetical protein GGR54DRAFT_175179 [Hypoxylon sp. NC1633]|nr:hypothetical protein GGR54DRAFT_175179 [Hypoxylon sp. NC1633]
MDDTTSLVADLLRKLTELDNKVNEYHQDMAQEFCRYSEQRLRDVPVDVSAKVEKLVAEQFRNYPTLGPSLDHHAIGSRSQRGADIASSDEKAWTMRHSSPSPPPPPASPQIPGSPVADGARSPHAREREFHGLFTPSYLPLLDAVQRRTPTPPSLPSPVSEVKELNNSQDTSPSTLVNLIPPRPDPARRHTEDTVSSVTSDDSAVRLRRSALRRSSSSSTKTQSPRRVRFEVEGEEVLPTSSPLVSPRALEFPPSLFGNPTSLLDESYNAIVIGEDTDLLGSSPPMPKKITSTDRLKAMARNSTEDTSKWEVVGNLDAIDDDEEEELVMTALNGRMGSDAHRGVANHANPSGAAHRINDARLPSQVRASLTAVEEVEETRVIEEADDIDDVLMMPPLSSFKGKKRFSPPLETTAESEAKTPDVQGLTEDRKQRAEQLDSIDQPFLDEEDMFEFEDSRGVASGNKDKNTKYIDEEEEQEEDEADATPIAENPALFPTSPSIPVAEPAAPMPASLPSQSIAASAGSYRGKSFTIGIVRDPEVHKKAAEMGDFYTFVGSVDGRSGVDESSSYRPELTYFNGTPRSLSERLLKEDLEEAHRNTGANSRD